MLENRTFYGEYSLQHWVKLILTQNVTLPEYQRYFVWDEAKARALIEAFKNKQFIPPITIGAYESNAAPTSARTNLILDGQQRITSVFLAYLSAFPNKIDAKTEKEINFADENDSMDDDDPSESIMDWNFNRILQLGETRESISQKIDWDTYKHLNLGLSDDFFKNNYLGFSYLVPASTSPVYQQNFYSTVFRNINLQGVTLLPQESRAALYFLDAELKDFFDPGLIKGHQVQGSRVDFARVLSLVSQYSILQDSTKLARGFARKMEKYYENFIYFNVGTTSSDQFLPLREIPDLKARYENLEKSIRQLGLVTGNGKARYDSIIDLDIKLFGLVYVIIFEGKSVDLDKINILNKDLADKIKEFRDDPLHTRNPGRLKYMRSRVGESINIYSKATK